MLNPYRDNPYRILGLTVGQGGPGQSREGELPEPLDLPGLPLPVRNHDNLMAAWDKVADPRTHRRYDATWFIVVNTIDKTGLDYLRGGQVEQALELWGRPQADQEPSTLQNLAVLSHLLALAESPGQERFWLLWEQALRSWLRLTGFKVQDVYLNETIEAIIEDLVELAQTELRDGRPEAVANVLRLFQRAGLPQSRLATLDKLFLGDEVDRLRYRCARIRERLITIMRERPPEVSKVISEVEREMSGEILPAIDWIGRAGLDGSQRVAKAHEEVSLLYRTLARTWGTLADDDHRQARALEAALRFAPPTLEDEMELELESLRKQTRAPELMPPLPQPEKRKEAEEEEPEHPPRDYAFLNTGLEMVQTSIFHHQQVGEGVYYVRLLGLNVLPLARYRLFLTATHDVGGVHRLPLTGGLAARAVVSLLALFFLVAFGLQHLAGPPAGVELELEQAGLRAKVDYLVSEASRLATRAAEAAETVEKLEVEMADLESRLALHPDDKTLREKAEETKVRLKKARITFEKLESDRAALLRRANRLNEALETYK
ncbi:MAG: hypothetical protein AB7S38_26840 [Vulcanimicrobiota bacterium]